jgi:hypothetical protein
MTALISSKRPAINGYITRLEYLQQTQQAKNNLTIQEIADEMNIKCDTDMLVKMFNAATWNSKNKGMINMLMHEIIALEDKHIQPPTPELIQVEVSNSAESENTQQEIAKE